VYTFLELLQSPVGPPFVLLLGAIVQWFSGRLARRQRHGRYWLTALALLFVVFAGGLLVNLRTQPVVPVYSHLWQPLLYSGANLYWVGDGWNWYISCLIWVLGGVGILLALNGGETGRNDRIHTTLAVNLATIAAALLFVGSGNLLTAVLTWVVMDIFGLVRSASRSEALVQPQTDSAGPEDNYARGLSLVGAMLLLIGLLPAGPTGPGQEFAGGKLPYETIYLMALASAIRAGIYPFHLWLLPNKNERVHVADRLLDHLVPSLSGLWLLGWTFGLSRDDLFLQVVATSGLLIALLGGAIAAWTARNQADHSTLVLVTSACLAALTGVLAYNNGPSAMIWPTAAFALGGGLWLVGEQVWQSWGWQIPVSVGALTLAGVPFTPGFLTQPALARLLTGDFSPAMLEFTTWLFGSPIFSATLIIVLLFGCYLVAQSLQIAALLRSWEDVERQEMPPLLFGAMARLLVASLALGLPLAVAGFLPLTVAALANLPDAIPPGLGNPPSVVADFPVWVTLSLPLLAGIGLVWLRPKIWIFVGNWPDRLNGFVRLDWLFSFGWWLADRTSEIWWNTLRVVEGAGYMGWLMVVLLMGYLLTQ